MTRSHQILFAVALLAVSSIATAEIPSDGLLNDVTDKFLAQSATWGETITGYATWLFWVLATISMVWTFGLMALRQADIGEFFAEFIRFSLATGFSWWILTNGPRIAMGIINSLRQVGAKAGKISGLLEPSTPISIGFDIVRKAFSGLSWVHPIDNLAIVIISACLVLCMAIVAANVLIALVTAWTMAYAGVFILGFGGARWTSDMAIAYLKSMLGIGLELLTVTLLVGVAVSVVDGFYNRVNAHSVYELLLVLCVCAVLAMLTNTIPARVAALAGGGSGANVSAGSMMGAAAMGAAAVASAGAAIAAGTASAVGGTQALMAAFSKAGEAGSQSGGAVQSGASSRTAANPDGPVHDGTAGGEASGSLATAMGDSDTGTHGASTSNAMSNSHSTDSPNSNEQAEGAKKSGGEKSASLPKAKVVGSKVGKLAAGTAANLVQGSWEVAKNSVANRVSNTAGGKIAAAIKARDAAEQPRNDEAAFGENSLSAGSEASDAASEIAAFRDRGSGGG